MCLQVRATTRRGVPAGCGAPPPGPPGRSTASRSTSCRSHPAPPAGSPEGSHAASGIRTCPARRVSDSGRRGPCMRPPTATAAGAAPRSAAVWYAPTTADAAGSRDGAARPWSRPWLLPPAPPHAWRAAAGGTAPRRASSLMPSAAPRPRWCCECWPTWSAARALRARSAPLRCGRHCRVAPAHPRRTHAQDLRGRALGAPRHAGAAASAAASSASPHRRGRPRR